MNKDIMKLVCICFLAIAFTSCLLFFDFRCASALITKQTHVISKTDFFSSDII